eukprot:GEMP01007610.1.p1 GENE.GEMP01007610.1~~GEMP01007610.1.p1  ORF type:complete len:1001 (+),score=249.27 GEMP01007610.1:51-3053(+)
MVIEASELFTWGNAINDQLGYQLGPKQTSQPYPKQVKIDQAVVHVACNKFHSACITAKKELYVWGTAGAAGRLGVDNKSQTSILPSLHPSFTPFRNPCAEVCCGRDHTMARTVYGSVFCWGSNEYGQCSAVAPKPLLVDLPAKAKGIACGDFSSLALTDEDLLVWGKDTLGCGETVTQAPTPRQIPNVKGAQAVFAAADVAAALVTGGFLVWGHGLTRPTKVRLDESSGTVDVEGDEWTTVRVHAQLTTVHIGRSRSVAIDQMGQLWQWNHGNPVARRMRTGNAELSIKQAISYESSLICVTTDGNLLKLDESTVTKLPLAQVESIASSGGHIAAIIKYRLADVAADAPEDRRVLSLETLCQQRICRTLTPRNVMSLLDMAVDFGFELLLESAVAFVALNQNLLEVFYAAPLTELVTPQVEELVAAYNRGESIRRIREREFQEWSVGNNFNFSANEDSALNNLTDKPCEVVLRRLRKKLNQILALEAKFDPDSSIPEEVRRKIDMKPEIMAALARGGSRSLDPSTYQSDFLRPAFGGAHDDKCHNNGPPLSCSADYKGDTDGTTPGAGNWEEDVPPLTHDNGAADDPADNDEAGEDASVRMGDGSSADEGEDVEGAEAKEVEDGDAMKTTGDVLMEDGKMNAEEKFTWFVDRSHDPPAEEWVTVKKPERKEHRDGPSALPASERKTSDAGWNEHCERHEPNDPCSNRREYALTDFIKKVKKEKLSISSNSTACSPSKGWNAEPDAARHASLQEIMDSEQKHNLQKHLQKPALANSLFNGHKMPKKAYDTHNSWGRDALPQEKLVEDFIFIQAQEKQLREEEKQQKEIMEIEAAFAAMALAETLDRQEREEWERQKRDAEKRREQKKNKNNPRRNAQERKGDGGGDWSYNGQEWRVKTQQQETMTMSTGSARVQKDKKRLHNRTASDSVAKPADERRKIYDNQGGGEATWTGEGAWTGDGEWNDWSRASLHNGWSTNEWRAGSSTNARGGWRKAPQRTGEG